MSKPAHSTVEGLSPDGTRRVMDVSWKGAHVYLAIHSPDSKRGYDIRVLPRDLLAKLVAQKVLRRAKDVYTTK